MGRNPLVSIGMPVYNGERYIEATLNSFLAQDHENCEITICDNASTDGTEEICRRFAAEFPNVRYLRNAENLGLIANFRRVAECAKGEYFMWAAHDDQRRGDFVSALLECLENEPDAVLATPATVYVNPDQTPSHHADDACAAGRSSLEDLKIFYADNAASWIYGLFRTSWLRDHVRQWEAEGYPVWGGDVLWMASVILRYRVVGTPEAVFVKRYGRSSYAPRSEIDKLRFALVMLRHLTRISLACPRRLRTRAAVLLLSWRYVYRRYVRRGNPLKTALRLIKLPILALAERVQAPSSSQTLSAQPGSDETKKMPVTLSPANPTVSIVLPVYNGQQFLREAVESCLQQTYRDWELILVDDASTDDSPAIIEQFVKSDSRIRSFRHDTNRRLPSALNTGFAMARGTYFTWTSDDNRYRPAAIEEMVRLLEGKPEIGLVYTDYLKVDGQGQYVRKRRARPVSRLLRHNCIGPCFLYRARIAGQIGGYAEDLYLVEDYDFWLRASMHFRFQPLHRDLYVCRRHTGSLTTKYRGRIAPAKEECWERNLPGLTWVGNGARAAQYLRMACRARARGEEQAAVRRLALAMRCSPFRVLVSPRSAAYVLCGRGMAARLRCVWGLVRQDRRNVAGL